MKSYCSSKRRSSHTADSVFSCSPLGISLTVVATLLRPLSYINLRKLEGHTRMSCFPWWCNRNCSCKYFSKSRNQLERSNVQLVNQRSNFIFVSQATSTSTSTSTQMAYCCVEQVYWSESYRKNVDCLRGCPNIWQALKYTVSFIVQHFWPSSLMFLWLNGSRFLEPRSKISKFHENCKSSILKLSLRINAQYLNTSVMSAHPFVHCKKRQN